MSGEKFDNGKLRYDLIPPGVLEALARVLTYGAQKYEPNGWMVVPDAVPRYTSALMRHLEAWRAGEKLDKESGLPHLAHVLCNAAFLEEFEHIEITRHDYSYTMTPGGPVRIGRDAVRSAALPGDDICRTRDCGHLRMQHHLNAETTKWPCGLCKCSTFYHNGFEAGTGRPL